MLANIIVNTYIVYAAVSVVLTCVLAYTLHQKGAVFLDDVFDKPETARAVNSMMVIGFYMLNLGYAFMIFRAEDSATTLEATENLVEKLGILLLSLGVIHFVNMWVFWRIRGRADNTFPLPPTVLAEPPPSPSPAGGPIDPSAQEFADQLRRATP